MKNISFGILLAFVFSCSSVESTNEIPSCIQNKINQLIDEAVKNPPTQIWKWEVDGETYFYITSDCCDQFNYLYSKNCEIVCAPDGGITGNGDGNCPTFTSEITKTLIWEDNRK